MSVGQRAAKLQPIINIMSAQQSGSLLNVISETSFIQGLFSKWSNIFLLMYICLCCLVLLAAGPPLAQPFAQGGIEGGKIFFFFQIFEICIFYIFLVIPRSWGVHRCPCWFENLSVNKAQAEVRTHLTLCFIIQIL